MKRVPRRVKKFFFTSKFRKNDRLVRRWLNRLENSRVLDTWLRWGRDF